MNDEERKDSKINKYDKSKSEREENGKKNGKKKKKTTEILTEKNK